MDENSALIGVVDHEDCGGSETRPVGYDPDERKALIKCLDCEIYFLEGE